MKSLCNGKGIGSGMPISCLLAESRIMKTLGLGEMNSTWSGNPICTADFRGLKGWARIKRGDR